MQNSDTFLLFQHLGLALLLGLLVGLQRERTAIGMPGLRTFPLITVLGTVCALLGQQFGGWIVAAGLLGVIVTMIFPHLWRMREKDPDPGTTTDIAALLMYGVGALLVVLPDQPAVAVAIGGGVAVLLQFKPELHAFAARLGDEDLRAIMQFTLVTCVVLPVVPDRAYDPFGVVNPRQAWLMVVLIVGMSLAGYILYKFWGERAGMVLGGILGGAISSTATTVAYARQAKEGMVERRPAAIVILIASAVVFLRIVVQIALVAPAMLGSIIPPAIIMLLLCGIPAVLVCRRMPSTPATAPKQGNPTQIRSALFFGASYVGVLWALAAAKHYISPEYLYAIAALSGLTDMDAITLSTARMLIAEGPGSWIAAHGWRLILCGAVSNLAFKGLIAGILGGWRLAVYLAALFLLPFAGGVLMIILWP